MAVAEIFLTAFITVLFEKLASAEVISLARSARIYSQLNKWKKTLSQIQCVLADAGQKQIKERLVLLWLRDLQDLAYDIDDVVDNLTTEAMRHRLNEESHSSKVMKIIPACCTDLSLSKFMYGCKMSSKLDEIMKKLNNLAEQKNSLRLINDNVERSSVEPSRRLEETSLVDESRIVGREGDKETLVGILLENESCKKNVSVVSIVGLGGIGKTTLAQVLYNEDKVKDHFELMAWVCVSDEFDVFNISKAIFQCVDGRNSNFANLNLLQEALKQKLSKKRFLFVLDDVWNENYKEWELLQRPFVVGAPGSKVVVTTRKTSITSVMDCVQAYHLDLLSNEEAISLFAQHALGEQNFDKHPTLKIHGEGIVKKCDGLPLALITLGRVLRAKTNNEEWEELLNNELWNLPNEGDILPALKLSYYDLPLHLKQIFAYSSLFTKDYVFNKDELVLLWMAEGFLYRSNSSKTMESLGYEYFEELKSRSFFQHSAKEKSRYIMHDLINDLATSVADKFFFRLDDKMKLYDKNEALEKSRYVSLIHTSFGAYINFMAFQKARRMRTFITMPRANKFPYLFLSNKVLAEFLPQVQFLRVLSLRNCSLTKIPKLIGSLKHIRYLNFSGSDITCLPEQISDLCNLQSLLVSRCCQLSSMPKSFAKLTNLRHLDNNDTPLLKKIPMGIGGLTSLQTLSKVIIGEANEFKITELKSLSHLKGRISIIGLHKVTNAIDAWEANLKQKMCLDDLEMEWSDLFEDSRNETTEYEVLEALRPHNKIRNLKICFYGGLKFPTWVGDPTFVQLTELTLHGCRSCTLLPTLGHMSSLRKLVIKSMNGVKILGPELFGTTNSCSGVTFPSLEILEFDNMQGWEIWSANCGEDNLTGGFFPCLREISIVNCPKLSVVSIGLIPSLQVLTIQGCSEAVFSSMVYMSSSILRLTINRIIGLTRIHEEFLKHLVGIEDLCIRGCDELEYLWELETQACNILSALQILRIESCEKLVSLGKKHLNLEIFLKSIRKVYIRNCKKLESYNCPKSIEKLVIFDCPSVTCLTFPKIYELPSSLKILDICGCDNLETSWLFHNFLSSLESFSIHRLPHLSSFHERCLIHLTYLNISSCDSIEYIPGPFLSLRSLQISDCKNLKSFPYENFQSITSLESLVIGNCPSLDCSFPCGLWPPNLTILRLGGLKKPMSRWGIQNFPKSLVTLHLHGENSGLVSFARANVGNRSGSTSSPLYLPSSLTFLHIRGFLDLESLSEGLQHLSCLENLHIGSCPKLRDLPETLLPKLSCFSVSFCSELQKKCRSRKGNYWPIISRIPSFDV
ncbi:putative disease resistance RPP13-like protein 1 [Tanacetum coccineum]